MYTYVGNMPTSTTDPRGLRGLGDSNTYAKHDQRVAEGDPDPVLTPLAFGCTGVLAAGSLVFITVAAGGESIVYGIIDILIQRGPSPGEKVAPAPPTHLSPPRPPVPVTPSIPPNLPPGPLPPMNPDDYPDFYP